MRVSVFSPASFGLLLASASLVVGILAGPHVQPNGLSRRQEDFDDPAILGGCEGACTTFNETFNDPACTTSVCLCSTTALEGLDNCVKCISDNSPSPEFITEFKGFAESYKTHACSADNTTTTGLPGASTTSTTTSPGSTTSTSTTSSAGTGVAGAQTTVSQSSSTGTPGNWGSVVKVDVRHSVFGVAGVAFVLSIL